MESSKSQSLIGNYVFDRRIRTTLSLAKITLCEFDLTDRIINWSVDETYHFYDFSKSYNGTFEGFLAMTHSEDRDKVDRFISTIDFNRNMTIQYRVNWIDGTYHWLETIGRAYAENGSTKIIGTIQDITDRKELEQNSKDWQQRLHIVTEAAGIIVYDYDIDSGNILWSGNIQEVLSFSKEEMGDIDRWAELIHPDDREEAFSLLEEAQEQLKTYEVYYRFQKRTGEYCHMYDRGTFLEKDGKAFRMLGMMSDVTELIHSRMALDASESRFESLMNNLNVGVGLYDESMMPVIHNTAAYTLLGMMEEQFVGTAAIDQDWNVLDNEGNQMAPADFPIPQAIAKEAAVRQVIMGVYRPKLNDRVWLMVDAEPVYNADHKLLHVICTYSNFTARKKMEEVLKEKNQQLIVSSEELKRKNERLLEFAQIVSHNLRSPLSNIAGLSELYSKSTSQEQDQAVQYIKEVCEKALDTISDLNTILKVQQDERLEKTRVKFGEKMDAVKELLKINLQERNVQIQTSFNDAPSILYPDIYIESILMNLLSNSIKYTDEDKLPQIEIKTYKKGHDVILLFSDKGIGIDLLKYGNDIFSFGKTFHKNKSSEGIGLFLVNNQIRTMGDKINVTSEVKKGTTFEIIFKNQYNEN
jgi:PAS domain S-box-containing protein